MYIYICLYKYKYIYIYVNTYIYIIIYIYTVYIYIYVLSKTNPGGDRCLFAGPIVTTDFFSINIDMENPGENQWFLLGENTYKLVGGFNPSEKY